jgi:hypothetical protein
MSIVHNPLSHPVDHIVGNVHHNGLVLNQTVWYLLAANYSRVGTLHKNPAFSAGHCDFRPSEASRVAGSGYFCPTAWMMACRAWEMAGLEG